MKKILVICSLLLLSTAGISAAQEELAMMSGVVLNEYNKLVPGAVIKITRKKVAHEVRVGEDGMYYSRLLEPGSYYLDIYVDGRFYTAKRISLAPPKEETVYYNFRLKSDGSAELYKDEYDPLERIKKAGENVPGRGD
jgi:hypothetical protein